MKTVVEQYNLRNQNTFGINAFCDYWIEFTEAEDIPNVMATLPAPKYRCIGQGSNMLFVNDFRGALLHSRILDMEMSTDDNDVLYASVPEYHSMKWLSALVWPDYGAWKIFPEFPGMRVRPLSRI